MACSRQPRTHLLIDDGTLACGRSLTPCRRVAYTLAPVDCKACLRAIVVRVALVMTDVGRVPGSVGKTP